MYLGCQSLNRSTGRRKNSLKSKRHLSHYRYSMMAAKTHSQRVKNCPAMTVGTPTMIQSSRWKTICPAPATLKRWITLTFRSGCGEWNGYYQQKTRGVKHMRKRLCMLRRRGDVRLIFSWINVRSMFRRGG